MNRHICVVEPCKERAEVEGFNHLVQLSPLPLTYHLPAIVGPESLLEDRPSAGVIVMGSTASVLERSSWQKALSEWLLVQIERRVPIFGICFAHQLIAELFGGKVEKRSQRELGFREVKLTANTLWGPGRKSQLFVTHGDEVTELPKDFEAVGTSETVAIDAMAHRSRPIWTFQSHPEATSGFVTREGHPAPLPNQLRDGHELMKRFLQLCASR